MASKMERVSTEDDRKEVYYLRLHWLMVKHGTNILKSTLDNKISKQRLKKKLKEQKSYLKKCLHHRVYNKLYSGTGEVNANSEEFDISLLVVLLRHISGLNPGSRRWNMTKDERLDDNITCEVADIVRLRELRNELCHPCMQPELEQKDFEALWNQAEKAMLRLASKCNIRDFKTKIEEAKTRRLDLITNEFRHLRERTCQFLNDYDDAFYVETSTFKKAKHLLDEHHFVVLSGHRGEGKTSMAARLALSVSSPKRCLILEEPSDWRQIDLSLNLIQTVIIDDLYGSVALDQRSVAEWSKYLESIHKAASGGHINVIITCVAYVMKQSDEEIGAIHGLLDKHEIEILELKSLNLTLKEKSNILQSLATKSSRDISRKMISECVSQASDQKKSLLCGFPQQASAFCKNDQLYRLQSRYFGAPFESFFEYLKDMYRRGGDVKENDKFVAFLLIWGTKDKRLHRSELEVTTASTHVKRILKVFGRRLDNTVVKTMLLSLESHIGGFLKYNHRTGVFTFSHSTICDAIGLVFGSKEPAMLLQICLRDFFMQYTTVAGFDETIDQYRIVYSEDMFPIMAEKCCSLILDTTDSEEDESVIQAGKYRSLERYGKRGNTLYISELIDSGIIKHSAFSCRTFVHTFLKVVRSKRLVDEVFFPLILSMCGRFLDYGFSVELLDMRLLDYALFSGAVEFAEVMLSSGTVDAKRMDLEMSLLLAIHSKRTRLIQLLLDRGARITSDALHVAICRSNTALELLLGQPGTNVNDQGNAVNGNYPLIIAASKSNYHAVKSLLKHDADPGVRNTMNITALHKAILLDKADNNRAKIVNVLIKHGSPLDVRGGERKRTPLHIAVDLADIDQVQKLLRHGASLFLDDKKGEFPVHTAIIRRHVGILKILLQSDRSLETQRMTWGRHQGRKRNWKDAMRGMSLFHTAINNIWKRARREMVDVLISLSVDPNVKDCYGRTPLIYAIERKHTDSVLQLMQYSKVNKRLADKQGRTPLHVAMQKDLDGIAAQLIPFSDINAKDKSGETALHVACTKLNVSAIDCLMKYDADFTMVNNNGDTVFHILTRRNEEKADYVVQYFLQLDPKIVDALPHVQNKTGQILNLTLINTGLRRIESLTEFLRKMKVRSTAHTPPQRRRVMAANMSPRRKRVATDMFFDGQSEAKRKVGRVNTFFTNLQSGL